MLDGIQARLDRTPEAIAVPRQSAYPGRRRLNSSAEPARNRFSCRSVAAMGKLKESCFDTASVKSGLTIASWAVTFRGSQPLDFRS